ncbi:MAG TPA: type II CAAX endopeptidase family protein [Propionibacteriaceae bacterium]|nr:type II CAAX endopeptidase family protein [Propionibacteriaceae bacterium]
MASVISAVRRHPLISFFVLAYLLSWWGWPIYYLNHNAPPIASFGPFLAALVVLAMTLGRSGVTMLFKRMVQWRVKPVWYVVAVGLPIAATLAATVLNVMLGAPRPSGAALQHWPSLGPTFLIVLLVPGFGGTWEEPGWRGYALPKLQERHSALAASGILGILWAFWHLPLMVVGQIAWSDLVLVVAVTVVLTWVFNGTAGSVLIAMILHATNNTVSGSFFSPLFTGSDSVRQSWMLALVWCVVAAVVVAVTGPAHLSRRRTKQLLSSATRPPSPARRDG